MWERIEAMNLRQLVELAADYIYEVFVSDDAILDYVRIRADLDFIDVFKSKLDFLWWISKYVPDDYLKEVFNA